MQEYLDFLKGIGKIRKFEKNNILFFEGEKALKFFILLKGRVRVYKSTAGEKEITLHYFTPPNFIAEMPTFKRLRYPANAICEEYCEILEIDFEDFETLCSQNKEFNFLLISSLFEKIKIIEKKLLENSLDLKSKLARYLLENEKNLAQISQRQIAVDLSVRAESLSRILKEFKNSELIETKKGKIEILDKEGLKKGLW
ncbi:Crp/Fnr family transcriptional regulator [Campylobacter coli]|nr:Crp/Fnr family transcriptional regulator [Campylobacter coli]